MPAYCVSYDLNRLGQRYKDLYEELKKSPLWWHHLDSTWLIVTSETATQLTDRLRRALDQNDFILVISVRQPSDGWLPKDAWDWIRANVP